MTMLRATAFALALVAAAPALAQEEVPVEDTPITEGPPALDPALNIDLMSDYRYRGVSRSDEDPSGRIGLTLYHDSGLYAGARATTLRGIDPYRGRDLGDLQTDLYLGYSRQLGGGFSADGGLLYHVFVGDGPGADDYVEPYASLSYLIGPATFTAGAHYAPAQDALGGDDMLYLYGRVDATVPFRPWAFSAELGRQESGAFGDYWNWSLGVTHHLQLEGVPINEIGLRYVDTDLPSGPGRDAGLVVTVNIGF